MIILSDASMLINRILHIYPWKRIPKNSNEASLEEVVFEKEPIGVVIPPKTLKKEEM